MASRGRPFPKGKSGNPGGRLKSNKEVVDLARACEARRSEERGHQSVDDECLPPCV